MKDAFAVLGVIPWKGGADQQTRVLSDYVENKATGSLATRLAPWPLFFQWAQEQQLDPASLNEETAHAYLSWMVAEGKPATRPSSFLGTIGFCLGSFGFGTGQLILMSARVRGVSLRGLETKGVTRKRDTLKMAWLGALEAAIVDACFRPEVSTLSSQEAAVAGLMAMLVHSRSRNKDLSRVSKEPKLDLADDGSGYIEAETTGDATKSDNAVKKARLQVPIVGLALGLSKAL